MLVDNPNNNTLTREWPRKRRLDRIRKYTKEINEAISLEVANNRDNQKDLVESAKGLKASVIARQQIPKSFGVTRVTNLE